MSASQSLGGSTPPLAALQLQHQQRKNTDKFSFPGQIESNYDETVDSFDTMNLKPELLRGTIRLIGLEGLC